MRRACLGENGHTFTAVTFTELFDRTKALPWGDWIPEDGKFTVVGKSVKSTLFSVSDCQAIVKKAVVEKLKEKYKTDWFDETGASYTIQVGILKELSPLRLTPAAVAYTCAAIVRVRWMPT